MRWRQSPITVLLVVVLLAGHVSVSASPEPKATSTVGRLSEGSISTTTDVANEIGADIVITEFTAPTRIRPGENYTAAATVRNTRPTLTVRRIAYRIEGTVLAATVVELPPKAVAKVTFNITSADTLELPHGTYLHGIYGSETNATSRLTIRPDARTSTSESTVHSAEQTTEVTSRTTSARSASTDGSRLVVQLTVENQTIRISTRSVGDRAPTSTDWATLNVRNARHGVFVLRFVVGSPRDGQTPETTTEEDGTG